MIESLVEQIEARYAEAQAQMSDPEVIADRQKYADAGRMFNQLAPAAKLAEEWRLAKSDADGAQEMLDEGGDEAEIRAGDLFRMYNRYAERLGFKPETMSASDGSYTFEIKGDGAYSVFKFEGGTHRVQRVPETESQGRIHTSTAT